MQGVKNMARKVNNYKKGKLPAEGGFGK